VLEVADMTTTLPVTQPGQNHPERVDVFRRAGNESTGQRRLGPFGGKDLDFERTEATLLPTAGSGRVVGVARRRVRR
jgi:hypothetical protein